MRVAESLHASGIIPDRVDSSLLDDWIDSMPYSRQTVFNYRRVAITLVRWGAKRGLCRKLEYSPKKIKQPDRIIEAWTEDEIRRLLAAAEKMAGNQGRTQLPRSDWWYAFVLVGYETGLRTSDIYHLKCSQLRNNRLYAVHHKIGIAAAKILSKQCVMALHRLRSEGPGETFFDWAICRNRIHPQFKKLLALAGLHGDIKWLRRSGATHCEKQQPGSASRFLGHISGQALAAKHYIDWSQLDDQVPRPPSLFNSRDSRSREKVA